MKNRPSNQRRVTFFESATGAALTSLWVEVRGDAARPAYRLLHPYADFQPVPGWLIEESGQRFEIVAVHQDGVLQCMPFVQAERGTP